MIIGLVGLKQSGKSTALEVIQSLCDAQEIQLAKHLKDVCAEAFSINRLHLDDQRYKEKPLSSPVVIKLKHLVKILDRFDLLTEDNLNKAKKHIGITIPTPRYAAQYVGTNILRDFDPDIHIKMAVKNMDKTKVGVVSDIRFHNEFEAFNDSGEFRSIFVRREAVIPNDLKSQHESERDVLDVGARCEVTIHNDSNLNDFRVRTASAVIGFLKDAGLTVKSK